MIMEKRRRGRDQSQKQEKKIEDNAKEVSVSGKSLWKNPENSDRKIRKIKSSYLSKQQIEDLDGAAVLDPPDMDAAIIGAMKNKSGHLVVVYSYDKLCSYFENAFDVPCSEEENPYDDAVEWIEYNVIRAIKYMGDRSPIVLMEYCDHCEDDTFLRENDDEVIEFNGSKWTVES